MAIKKNIKKQYSTHTSYLRGTGGGSYVPPPTPKNGDEKLLMETIAISVKGLQNEFDSDALAGCYGMSAAQLTSMDQSQIIEVDMIETDWNEPHAQLLQTPKHPLLNIYNLSDDEIEKGNKVPETQENHPAVLSENLPNPHSEDLTTQKEFNLPQPTTWQTRRRPVIPKRKTVSSVAGKFEILAEQKCQLIEIEKNIAKQRETYSKTEQEMNLKLLEGQNEEQKLKIKFLESQLGEQKLKIELLKIQINNLQSVKKIQISSSGR
ncbi:unnamed protein product [Phaedon cochleariae]|uniref:Uncharacterized protein n=1 Tax=Phaedon cochleariae TaxID=80249 RepID=A0A9N9SC49_PHACE|nr:unnamed protein product [Phaedon cochleariae]